MTDTFTMGGRDVAFILSMEDAAGTRSIENATLVMANLPAGSLVCDDGGGIIYAYTDGATPCGILLHATDASAESVKVAYLARDAVVNGEYLNFPAENSAGTAVSSAISKLASLNIIVRKAAAVSAQ